MYEYSRTVYDVSPEGIRVLNGEPRPGGREESHGGGSEANEAGRDRAPVRPAAPRADPVTIVLVDDEFGVRLLLRRALESRTHLEVVGEAANGRDALGRVAELEPDIVLMDARMPVMDGITATRLISQRHPAVRVLATSQDAEALQAMLEAGATQGTRKADLKKLLDALEDVAAMVHRERATAP